jgi:hypothetical protein
LYRGRSLGSGVSAQFSFTAHQLAVYHSPQRVCNRNPLTARWAGRKHL